MICFERKGVFIMSKLHLGAQLYTVREFTKDETSFAATMKKIADIGYNCVQVSGTGPLRPGFVAEVAKENGIKVVLTHSSFERMRDETDVVIAEHNVFDCDAIGIGGIWGTPRSYDGFMQFCENVAAISAKMKAAGKFFLYHNHRFEFEKYNGKYAIEIIMENTDPDAVKLTFDTYWATAGGVDPAQFIDKYGDRIYATHLKDMAVKNDAVLMTEMLTGNINFDSILKASADKNVIWHMIEQDDVYMDAFESMKISYDNLLAAYPQYFK